MKSLRERAMDYLARREHSRLELIQKLCAKGFNKSEVERTVQVLCEENLQSDERFTEAFVCYKVARGYGPRHIAMGLQQRGIANNLIARYLTQNSSYWAEVLASLWQKRYAACPPQDIKAKARAIRFLINRGFAPDQVQRLVQ